MALAALSPLDKAENGFPVDVRHPVTNLPIGVTITVCGSDSQTFKTIQRKQLNRRIELSNKSRNKTLSMTAEEIELESLNTLVACTKSWSQDGGDSIEMNEGEWLPCTPENVKRVYTELPWIREQVDQEIGDRNNFLKI